MRLAALAVVGVVSFGRYKCPENSVENDRPSVTEFMVMVVTRSGLSLVARHWARQKDRNLENSNIKS